MVALKDGGASRFGRKLGSTSKCTLWRHKKPNTKQHYYKCPKLNSKVCHWLQDLVCQCPPNLIWPLQKLFMQQFCFLPSLWLPPSTPSSYLEVVLWCYVTLLPPLHEHKRKHINRGHFKRNHGQHEDGFHYYSLFHCTISPLPYTFLLDLCST